MAEDQDAGRPRRRWWLVLLGFGALWAVVAVVLAALGASAAQRGADRVRALELSAGVEELVEGELDDDIAAAERDFATADRLLSNPLLAPVRLAPIAGRQLRTADALAGSARDVLAVTGDAIGSIRDELDEGVPGGPGRVELLDRLVGELETAEAAIGRADLGPDDALFGPLQDARAEMAVKLDDAARTVDDALVATRTLRDLLAGPSEYVVLGANNAEMRTGAGMFLSVGSVELAEGRLGVGDDFSATADLVLPTSVPLPDEIDELWGWSEPGRDWRNLALSARFPAVAPIAAAMWAEVDGSTPDGVLAVDVVALQSFLELTGPVRIDGTTIAPGDALDFLLHDQYLELDEDVDNAARRERLAALAGAVLDELGSADLDLLDVFETLRAARDGRHLLVWSADEAQQDAWDRLGVAGDLGPNSLLVALANSDGSKLDPFVGVTVTPTVAAADQDGVVDLRLAVTIDNDARANEPSYVLGDDDSPDYRGILVFHLPGAAAAIDTEGGSVVAFGPDGPTTVVALEIAVAARAELDVVLTAQLPASVGADLVVAPSARVPPTVWRLEDREQRDRRPFALTPHGA